MKKQKGFIGFILLQLFVGISAGALWWWHSVEHISTIAIERSHWYNARYAAEYAARMVARSLAPSYRQLYKELGSAALVLSGNVAWHSLQQSREYFVEVRVVAQSGVEGLIISTVLTHRNGTKIVFKGLLHAGAENNTPPLFDCCTLSAVV